MRGVKTLKRSARLIRSRFVQGALILLYHRIADGTNDPFSMNVTPARFAEHLDVIKRIGQPISLRALVDGLEQRSIPSRGIVVTFDDGYADNWSEARPLLEQASVPATVFVTAGLMGAAGECWWDALVRIVLQGKPASESLKLVVGGRPREFRAASREVLLRSVHQVLRPLGHDERAPLLDTIARWAGVRTEEPPAHRMMTAPELRELAASPMVDIGGHTLTHPVLARLTHRDAMHELNESRRILEEMVGRPVACCAYPYGVASDYSGHTIAIARGTGYRAACTAIPDVVWRGSHPYELPRLWVENWTGDVFARKLAAWLGK